MGQTINIRVTESSGAHWDCRNPGLNQGPLDPQPNALPTELIRIALTRIQVCLCVMTVY